ncbi:MAG: polysaccharide deacetylase family protein [Ignavibacteriales bacterium]|nr:polysaccharide deacetylase family protein [Ignavibacteriales bacterium]
MADLKFLVAEPLTRSIVWRGARDSIYLTFDDGPHPEATPTVLRVLRAHKIHATFFLVGAHIERHRALAQSLVQEGHALGNHGYAHRPLWFSRASTIADELHRTQRLIDALTSSTTRWVRPPYSRFDPFLLAAIRRLGYRCVMYSVDSKDYRLQDSHLIAARATKNLAGGDIILMHDNDFTARTIERTLSNVVEIALAKGLKFSTLSGV